MAKILLALAFASMAQAISVSKATEKEMEQKQDLSQEELAKKKQKEKAEAQEQEAKSIEATATGSYATSAALSMRDKAMSELQQWVVAEKEKEASVKTNREKRWAGILHKQKESLLQHETALKAEEKDLKRMQREKEWKQEQREIAVKQEAALAADASNCAGQKSTLSAFISATDSHASCLKSQLGACLTTETTALLSLKCDEPSAGWQKKCLADKAQDMVDCAPLGVDWNAMRRGEKGPAADNAALQRLGEWCTFHRALGKIHQSKATSPFSLILSKDAAVSKDAAKKLSDFGENFHQQEWDFLQVDPVGKEAALHSVLVKNDSAERLQKAMSQMKAVPLDKMPKAVNDAGTAKAVSWTAGVSGMLERESSDCSLQSPALLKPVKDETKLVAALR